MYRISELVQCPEFMLGANAIEKWIAEGGKYPRNPYAEGTEQHRMWNAGVNVAVSVYHLGPNGELEYV